jgi:hypothetical protein
MCDSLTCFMTQDGLNYLADVPDTINCRPLVDHHTYMAEVQVSMQQPRGPDEERGLAGTQR